MTTEELLAVLSALAAEPEEPLFQFEFQDKTVEFSLVAVLEELLALRALYQARQGH